MRRNKFYSGAPRLSFYVPAFETRIKKVKAGYYATLMPSVSYFPGIFSLIIYHGEEAVKAL